MSNLNQDFIDYIAGNGANIEPQNQANKNGRRSSRRMVAADSGRVVGISSESGPRVWMTGPDLIDRIVRAVELGQSVLLSGPRGCGKSYCCRQVIKESERRGIVTLGASKTFQGNREVPRSDVFDDDIEFQVLQNGDKLETFIEKRSAPIFAFADRDEKNRVKIDPHTGKVPCFIEKKGEADSDFNRRPVKRFILFLDEVNRFADGILDAMLTILEEKFALMGGTEYHLPITVLMTMNPPGYDATARVLSPPLAARISRSYRLFSPDMDTLTDIIISSKMDALEKSIQSDYVGQTKLASTSGKSQVQFDRTPEFFVDPSIRRKVALITLLLWGNPKWRPDSQDEFGNDDEAKMRAGMEYLTEDSRRLILEAIENVPALKEHLDTLSELCRFGPDGRAAADWLTSAAAYIRQNLPVDEVKPRISISTDDLIETCVEALSHKIYDDFSPASEPDKVANKERAVLLVAQITLNDPRIDELEVVNDVGKVSLSLTRIIDRRDFGDAFQGLVEEPDRLKRTNSLYKAFATARVTADDDTKVWMNCFRQFSGLLDDNNGDNNSESNSQILASILENAATKEQVHIEDPSTPATGELSLVDEPIYQTKIKGGREGFTKRKWLMLCNEIGCLSGPLPRAMRGLVKRSNHRVAPSANYFIQKSIAAKKFNSSVADDKQLEKILLNGNAVEHTQIVVKLLNRLADLDVNGNRAEVFFELLIVNSKQLDAKDRKELFESMLQIFETCESNEVDGEKSPLFGITADFVRQFDSKLEKFLNSHDN